MKIVCKRYLFDKEEVSAVLNAGFMKVFEKMESYSFQGSFEGWVRRIVINECLNENKKKHLVFEELNDLNEDLLSVEAIEEGDEIKAVLKAIAELPEGYRLVFNLYEVEGYSHKEIADELGIAISASRSQLARVKKILRKRLKNIEGI